MEEPPHPSALDFTGHSHATLFELGQQRGVVHANGGHAIRVLERPTDPRLADDDLDDLAGVAASA